MTFYSIDTESRSVSEVQEPRTLQAVHRIMATAIGRWILSGLPYPDMTATDGVSEQEAALNF